MQFLRDSQHKTIDTYYYFVLGQAPNQHPNEIEGLIKLKVACRLGTLLQEIKKFHKQESRHLKTAFLFME